ncbi:UNVERIFIED_CONTAM: hypothetical protein Q9R58_13955 [Methylobacteriaceae bacterium AG10]|nr:hypothetical protein [Methylobacteriaceae bacterium AG10]
MPRALSPRRLPRARPAPRRLPRHRAHGGPLRPVRVSDLVLALLFVALLGALALLAAFALAAGTTAP